MKLSTKLALGYGLLFSLLLGLILFHFSTAHANAEAGQQLSRVTSRLLTSATEQQHWIDQMEESAAKYRISGDSGYVAKFDEYADRFDGALERLRRFDLTSEERDRLRTLVHTWSVLKQGALRPRRFEPVSPERGSGSMSDLLTDDDVATNASLRVRFDDLRGATENLMTASLSAMEAQVQAARQRTRRAEILAWIGSAIALLVSAGVWIWVVRRIRSGLRILTDGTRRVAEGEFRHRLDPEGQDEFAELSRDFNAMTERLAELDELKDRFVDRISHDLKSPLASMQEANNLLLDELVGPLTEDQRRILGLSRENGRQLSERIGRLLEISRLEAGTEAMDFGRHDLSARIRGVADRLAASFVQADTRLDLDLRADEVPCICDGERIDQLVENLLDNARRYAPPGTVVHVSLDVAETRPADIPADRWNSLDAATATDGAVRLSVTDAGRGVPDEVKEQIFNRFYRQNGVSPGEAGGSGLGLALCREITERHGGTIWVEDAPSGGARFTALLPRRPAGAGDVVSPAPAARV